MGPMLPSWSHYKSLDFVGGCADSSYIQLLPALPSTNEKQEELACVAAAGWLPMLKFAGRPPRHGTLPGASLPGKNLVFWEHCSQAGTDSPSSLALLLPFLRVR